MKKRNILLSLAIVAALSSPAQAALVVPPHTVYDTDREIYWLGNANLAATETFGLGYDTDLGDHPDDPYGSSYGEFIRPSGRMSWGAALHWIDAMNTANYLGFDNWRLPTALNADGSGPCGPAYNCTGSEMGHLFYDELGGTSGQSILDTDVEDYFINVQSYAYWSGTEYALGTDRAWMIANSNGYQISNPKHSEFYAWPVRSSVVSTAPVSAAVWLFGSAVAMLGWMRRKAA